MEKIRYFWIVASAYLSVCLGIWLYLCFKYGQILDVRLSQFLTGWWRWLA